MSKNLKLILSSVLLLVTSNVTALPITGTMEMGGSFYALDGDGNQTSIASEAISIDFDFFGFDMFVVNTASGDFDGLAGQYGDIQDIQFEPFVVFYLKLNQYLFDLNIYYHEPEM